MYDETALLPPHISTFPELLKFLMPVIICLPICTYDIHVYLLSYSFNLFNICAQHSLLPLVTASFISILEGDYMRPG